MSKQMKFIVFLMLLMLSEISATHLKTQDAEKRHHFYGKNRLLLLTAGDNPLIEKIKAKFNQLGTAAENSKLFNFMLGAALKIFSLLQGNEVLDIHSRNLLQFDKIPCQNCEGASRYGKS